MSLVLYHGGGAGDFNVQGSKDANGLAQYARNVSDLLEVRGHHLASELFNSMPWQLRDASNSFNDDFSVLYAVVGLQQYEQARRLLTSPAHNAALRQLAETVAEVGPYIRFIAVELDPQPMPRDSRCLTNREIEKLVYKYIGVSGGYLGDFNYRTHYEFYVDLDLNINPHKLSGTTRERFMRILSEADHGVQARILQGILDRYSAESLPNRTAQLRDEIVGWIDRLGTGAVVTVKRLRVTSAVVERALQDAEKLMASTGATSGVDRAHTALHGYVLQVCSAANIITPPEPSLTQLFKALRTDHPAFTELGPRSHDVAKLIGSIATVVDVLNPLRNKASVAHPNQHLLAEPEALLFINSARTLLNYLDSKLHQGQKISVGS
jgi:Abortive infection C-terminus